MKAKPSFTYLILLMIFFVYCSLILVPPFLVIRPIPLIDSSASTESNNNSIINCDRTDKHSDICVMQGDIRAHSPSSTIFLLSNSTINGADSEEIRPYTRKWDVAIKDKINMLHLKGINAGTNQPSCEVQHDVPALVFSAGGYTGNVFHDYNDGLIPLYITSHHLNRKVALVVLHFHEWWYSKYHQILSQLSDHPPIDFFNDTRTHCFPAAIVGLHFRGTLTIGTDNKTISNFHYLLDKAYDQNTTSLKHMKKDRPKLVIVSRKGARTIENEAQVVELGNQIGFEVDVLSPTDTTPMAAIYKTLSTCDVMIGVHGAALTHFLLMRPGSLLIQIVPYGLDREARACFEEPAMKMGVLYQKYMVLPSESSLSRKYKEGEQVMKDPESMKSRGWEVIKEIYLSQNVTIDLNRLQELLLPAFHYITSKSS